ncbi:hypothetical protein SAMN05444141_104202 [Pseudovibrio denitrificans]|uniref:Peptidase MA superfamily protein n=1 Tax=Pseudovibrio denitrificans TaxID=258256 RepID=A0A1I7BQQ8_9HYPH|nr:hypothetical protein [Pseudovibrio denitrificans]SFT89471.1 hypothetical protein SAMN05444141_104202 [Pseudovibrio denitrificans]
MRLSLFSFMAALSATSAFAQTPPLQIIIEADKIHPEVATATITLPAEQEITLLASRTQSQPSDTNALQLICDGVEVLEPYGRALACRKLQWNVTFQNPRETPLAVANQQNLYSPQGWWSITEWDDIPRLESNSTVEVCGKVQGAETTLKCAALPTANEPPLILSWGDAAKTLRTNQTTLTLYKDDPTEALKADNLPALQKQLEYLQSILGASALPEQNIDLVWVAIDKKLGQIAGAAGKQAFLANVATSEGKASPEDIAKLHWVSAHELFHLLTTTPYPLWISESLAQYYGYKSLKMAGIHSESPMDQWQVFKERFPHAATGLYEAHQKVTGDNDPSYYPLFYVKGAAFWQAVDEELQKQGTALDQLMTTFEEQQLSHELPQSLLNALKQSISEERLKELQQQFLL